MRKLVFTDSEKKKSVSPNRKFDDGSIEGYQIIHKYNDIDHMKSYQRPTTNM